MSDDGPFIAWMDPRRSIGTLCNRRLHIPLKHALHLIFKIHLSTYVSIPDQRRRQRASLNQHWVFAVGVENV